MSDLHLNSGSAKPPLTEGKLRLYSMLFCPYAERARLILLVKKLPHDIVNINLHDKPAWLFEINSAGKVPVLDTHKEIIPESLDICDYLDRLYPEPPLYPTEEKEIIKCKEIIKEFDSLISLYYQAIRQMAKSLDEYIKDMMPHLEKFENILKSTGKYFGGSDPNMVDYMLWPWAERVEVLSITFKETLPVGENTLPAIFKWCKAMRALPVIRETILSPERLHKASLILKTGIANYDEI